MYWLGIDLGGTNIATGVVDENYNIIGRGKLKTNAGRSAEELADDIIKAAQIAIKNANIDASQITSMGIGVPGSIDPEKGIVIRAENLYYENLPLCQMLKDRTGYDFYIENDANAAAYGELIAGVGKGKKHLIAITLGTGVGGGIIIDGKIYSGATHAGGELGHTIMIHGGVPCSCGNAGCFEAYASATALIRQTKDAMIKNKDSIMWNIATTLENVNGLTAFDAMRKGDKAGTDVVNQYIEYLCVGIYNMINIFQPEIICIGGGISKEGDVLLNPIKKYVTDNCFAHGVGTEIKIAKLGNDAGIIGAAFLCNLYK